MPVIRTGISDSAQKAEPLDGKTPRVAPSSDKRRNRRSSRSESWPKAVVHEDRRVRITAKIFFREGSTPRKAAAPPSMTVSPSTRTLNSPYGPRTISHRSVAHDEAAPPHGRRAILILNTRNTEQRSVTCPTSVSSSNILQLMRRTQVRCYACSIDIFRGNCSGNCLETL